MKKISQDQIVDVIFGAHCRGSKQSESGGEKEPEGERSIIRNADSRRLPRRGAAVARIVESANLIGNF